MKALLTTLLATTLFSIEPELPKEPTLKKHERKIKFQTYTTANPLPGVGISLRSNFQNSPHNFEASLSNGYLLILNFLNGSINYIYAPKPEGIYLGTGIGFSNIFYWESGTTTTPIFPAFIGYQGSKGFIDAGANLYPKEDFAPPPHPPRRLFFLDTFC